MTIDELDAGIEGLVERQKSAGVALWIRWTGEPKTHSLELITAEYKRVTFCGRIIHGMILASWVGSGLSGGKYCAACVLAIRLKAHGVGREITEDDEGDDE